MKYQEVLKAIENNDLFEEDITIQYKGKDGKTHILNNSDVQNWGTYNLGKEEDRLTNKMYNDFDLLPGKVKLDDIEMEMLNTMRILNKHGGIRSIKNEEAQNINRGILSDIYKPCPCERGIITESGNLIAENEMKNSVVGIIKEYDNKNFKY